MVQELLNVQEFLNPKLVNVQELLNCPELGCAFYGVFWGYVAMEWKV